MLLRNILRVCLPELVLNTLVINLYLPPPRSMAGKPIRLPPNRWRTSHQIDPSFVNGGDEYSAWIIVAELSVPLRKGDAI